MKLRYKIFSIIIIFFVVLGCVQLFGHYANYKQLQRNKTTQEDLKSKSNTDYEKEHKLPIIKVNDDVYTYYNTKKWTLNKGFENMTGMHTKVITQPVQITSGSAVATGDAIDFNIDVHTDKKNKSVKLYRYDKKSKIKAKLDIRVIDKKMYALSHMYDKQHKSIKLYAYSKNSFDIGNLTVIYDFINAICKLKSSNYDIIYNCRTKFHNQEVDDVTIIFNDVNYGIHLFVDTKTKKVKYIFSNMISNNDFSEIMYDKHIVEKFTKNDVKNLTKQSNDKLTKLPDGNKGNILNKKYMFIFCDLFCQGITSNNISLSNTDVYAINATSKPTQ